MRISIHCTFLVLLIVAPAPAQESLPVIDVHLHALAADHQGSPPVAICTPIDPFPAWDPAQPYGATFMAMLKQPPCDDPIWSPETDEELMTRTIRIMQRRNIFGVLSGTPERVADWMAAAPDRFFPGLEFQLGGDSPSTDSLRTLHAQGRLAVLGEVTNQYAGIAPGDERMDPYWKLAEELDLPVGIHIGTGPPGAIYLGASGYRARLHSALTLEEVLVRHPGLRVYIMHAGFPLLDDLLALLYVHPQVYVDVGVIVFTQPRAAFYGYLRGIVEAGFGNRVMFGSDQMVWPGVIERSIAVIEEAGFLNEGQKRDILYNNAARFLRLSEEEIARHHGQVPGSTIAASATAEEMLSIETANGTSREKETKAQLESILRSYDVDKWLFTTTVIIDEESTPHSHPALTLHTRHLDNDRHLLSTFLHEQIHWHLVSRAEGMQAAIETLGRIYEDVPVGGREGGRDRRSTYLHLLVNFLEYQAMKELIGEGDATEVMQFWATDHYTWIYTTMLKDERKIAQVIDKFDLRI